MAIIKVVIDKLLKTLHPEGFLPHGVIELRKYFHHNESINFSYKKEGGAIIAISTNFRYGSIVTSGRTEEEVDENVKDAILTVFEIPSSYAKEAGIINVSKAAAEQKSYALA